MFFTVFEDTKHQITKTPSLEWNELRETCTKTHHSEKAECKAYTKDIKEIQRK